jgi:hypothetical protein
MERRSRAAALTLGRHAADDHRGTGTELVAEVLDRPGDLPASSRVGASARRRSRSFRQPLEHRKQVRSGLAGAGGAQPMTSAPASAEGWRAPGWAWASRIRRRSPRAATRATDRGWRSREQRRALWTRVRLSCRAGRTDRTGTHAPARRGRSQAAAGPRDGGGLNSPVAEKRIFSANEQFAQPRASHPPGRGMALERKEDAVPDLQIRPLLAVESCSPPPSPTRSTCSSPRRRRPGDAWPPRPGAAAGPARSRHWMRISAGHPLTARRNDAACAAHGHGLGDSPRLVARGPSLGHAGRTFRCRPHATAPARSPHREVSRGTEHRSGRSGRSCWHHGRGSLS